MFESDGIKNIGAGAAPNPSTGAGDGAGDDPGRSVRPSRASSAGRASQNWSIYTIKELVRFRDEIGRALPPLELSKLNLEEEVLLQFHTMRELQGDVMEDETVPANQRAQVANSVASTLKTLADRQSALYTSERFKDIENLLIRTLTKLGEALAAEFIDEYEKILKRHDE